MDTQDKKLTFKFPRQKEEKTAYKYNDGFHAYQSMELALKALGHTVGSERPTVGVLWLCKTNKGSGFIIDALELCGNGTSPGVDGLLIVTADGIKPDEIPFRESPIICAHKDRVQFCKADLWKIINAVEKLKSSVDTDQSFQHKLAQVVAAFAVFQPIGVAVGHGARNDVANRLLAPIRLLAKSDSENAAAGITELWTASKQVANGGKSCWDNFGEALKDKSLGKGNALTKELCSEIDGVRNAFEKALTAGLICLDAVAAAAEGLMTLMTEFRRNAGIVTDVESAKGNQETTSQLHGSGKLRPLPADSLPYRLLVVDDHWKDWEPALDCIKKKIGVPIDIQYSGDGMVAWDVKNNTGIPIVAAAFQADAVLLDIMIDGVNGLDVLKEIREYSNSIPVILWTTTRSQEITNRAQQANGVILKKTCDAEAFTETLANWLQIGRNRRGVSLLNPFFDSVIRRPEYRQYANDVTEWALKWMDGFAGMNATFRVFTNHGGRHYTKILGYIEHAIQSLLGKKDDGHPFFADNAETREQEFLCLYVSVFLHELGMFPIKTDGEQILESAQYVQLVRTLHAPRGMLLLEGNNDWLWLSDKEGLKRVRGDDTGLHINDIGIIRAKCAVLVGYHARFMNFKKSDKSVFLSTKDGWYNSKRFKAMTEATEAGMFYLEAATTESECSADTLIAQCVQRLGIKISNEAESLRLLRMSAVLRLCDAIDKGESRNPPVYLSNSCPFILTRAQQERETLKQMVCGDMWVDGDGSVCCKMLTTMPNMGLLTHIFKAVKLYNEDRTRKPVPTITDQEEVKTPWNKDSCTKSAAWLDFLEHWLDYVWMNEIGGVKKEDRKAVKAAMEVLKDKKCVSGTGKLNKDGVAAVAQVSALFSVTEILDEYKAIHDANLTRHIPLGECEWADSDIHAKKVDEVWQGLQQARRGKRDSATA